MAVFIVSKSLKAKFKNDHAKKMIMLVLSDLI